MSNDKQISKFADALPTEWNEFLINPKQDSRFSKFYLKEFIRELKIHKYENDKKKKDVINEIEKNFEKISLEVIFEIRRVYMCIVARKIMKYDIKRGCYIDENMNPLDFVNFFFVQAHTRHAQFKKNLVLNQCAQNVIKLNQTMSNS
ncbi:hypothetical protein Hanom_Chr11g01014611 [Helianthus anomalus]